jgi:hypothetical protein
MKNRCRASIATAAFVAAVCVASAAQAFTMQDGSGQSSGQGFLDLDKPSQAPDRMAPVNRFGNDNGQATYKTGNGTFQFGQQQSFGQKYNTENMFNPYAREGR